MNTRLVCVGENAGRLFEGEVPETFCFVPQELLSGEGENIQVAEVGYVAGHWDERNMRSNLTVEGGSRLFPDARRPVVDVEAAPVQSFLSRLRFVWTGGC